MSNVSFTTPLNGVFTLEDMADHVTKRIFEMVAAKGWSDPEFARRIGGETQRQHVNNWRKRRPVPPARYSRIAEVLGVSIDDLVGREPVENVSAVAEQPATYEVLVGSNHQQFIAEFKKLSRELQMQVSQLVHLMVAEGKRVERAKGPKTKPSREDRPSTRQ